MPYIPKKNKGGKDNMSAAANKARNRARTTNLTGYIRKAASEGRDRVTVDGTTWIKSSVGGRRETWMAREDAVTSMYGEPSSGRAARQVAQRRMNMYKKPNTRSTRNTGTNRMK